MRSKTSQQADCDRDARAASNASEQFENKPSSRTAYAAIAPCWRISVHNRPSLPFATIYGCKRSRANATSWLRLAPPPGGRPRWRTPIHLTPPASLRERDSAPDPVSEQDRDRTRITMRCLYLKSYDSSLGTESRVWHGAHSGSDDDRTSSPDSSSWNLP